MANHSSSCQGALLAQSQQESEGIYVDGTPLWDLTEELFNFIPIYSNINLDNGRQTMPDDGHICLRMFHRLVEDLGVVTP